MSDTSTKLPLKLSYTSVSTYLACSKKYELHYIHKLRENSIASALFFGSAMDEALGRLKLEKKQNLSDSEKELLNITVEEVFLRKMKTTKLNGEEIDLSSDFRAKYTKGDWEESLCEDADSSIIERVFENIKEKRSSTENDYMYFQKWMNTSLIRKGLLFIETYRNEVMPLIKEVFSIQRKESLSNELGDEIYGLIDSECEFIDEPGVRYTEDDKTSSIPYKVDSVKTSEQLSIYDEFTLNKKGAYIVIEKKIRKRDPKVRITIIRDDISEETKNVVFEKIENVTEGIKNNVFNENWNSCYQYGQPCPYLKYCKHNDASNLIQIDHKRNK